MSSDAIFDYFLYFLIIDNVLLQSSEMASQFLFVFVRKSDAKREVERHQCCYRQISRDPIQINLLYFAFDFDGLFFHINRKDGVFKEIQP